MCLHCILIFAIYELSTPDCCKLKYLNFWNHFFPNCWIKIKLKILLQSVFAYLIFQIWFSSKTRLPAEKPTDPKHTTTNKNLVIKGVALSNDSHYPTTIWRCGFKTTWWTRVLILQIEHWAPSLKSAGNDFFKMSIMSVTTKMKINK